MTPIESMSEAELVAEMQHWLRGKQSQSWHRIRYGDGRISNPTFDANGECTADDGIDRLTTLRALVAANRRRYDKRSTAANKAAKTRSERQEREVYRVAQRLVNGGTLTPSSTCRRCGKPVTDAESIERGIGSDCWQFVLAAIKSMRDAEEVAR